MDTDPFLAECRSRLKGWLFEVLCKAAVQRHSWESMSEQLEQNVKKNITY